MIGITWNNKSGELVIHIMICTSKQRYDKCVDAECATGAILSGFTGFKDITISYQFNQVYLNVILGVFPDYANSKVTNYQKKAILKTGIECSLKVPDVWFDEIPPAPPYFIIINDES